MKKKGVTGLLVTAIVAVLLKTYTPLPEMATSAIADWAGNSAQELVE